MPSAIVNMPQADEHRVRWIVAAVATAALLVAMFYDSGTELVRIWSRREEYSHGFFLPLVSAWWMWRQRAWLRPRTGSGTWWGLPLCALGLCVYVLGTFSALYVFQHYAMLLVLAGLMLSIVGWQGLRRLWPALALLVFMVPLPPFLYNAMSTELQLVSSRLGVIVVRAFGISVFLEGNVIDLGSLQLQVAEACSGLRYLFPLMSFGFICAYHFQAPWWQRLVVVISTVPIAIVMNSLRIGVIGVLVEYGGVELAEGFLHDFEGWAVFMLCVVLLFVEMWLLARFCTPRHKPRPRFALYAVDEVTGEKSDSSPISPACITACLLIIATGVLTLALVSRDESPTADVSLVDFPSRVGDWSGRHERIGARQLSALKLSDYVLGTYRDPDEVAVGLFIAYYASQSAGQSAHSPRACIPGDGWEIVKLDGRVLADGHDVNRVEIQRHDQRQLVYYWFDERERRLTNEYLVKWYLFWDALTRNRTDGALIRLTTPVVDGEDWVDADRRLALFAADIASSLETHLNPDSTRPS